MAADNDREQGADRHASSSQNTDQAAATSATEDQLTANKQLARHLAEALINDRNLTSVEDHVGTSNTAGRVRWLLAALPDAHVGVDWQVAEGEWVVTGLTVRGTHLGEWEGLPPTGKPVTLHMILREQVIAGKIAYAEVFMDLLPALEQVGAHLTLRQGV